MTSKVEEKLYQNRYVVDEGNPHIRIPEEDARAPSLAVLASICPAACWAIQPDGAVTGSVDGCFECGTCRIVAAAAGVPIDWDYPRGGYGIAYKFG